MKRQNQYRSEQRAKIKLLEKALSLKHRVFSMITMRRAAQRARKLGKICLWLVPALALLWVVGSYALEKAYGLSIDHISFKSIHGIITKEQALRILGIEGSVNIATLNSEALKAKLESSPAICSASLQTELPDTLYI